MESASWSLRLALALVVASAIWAGAIALTDRLVAGRAGRLQAPVAIARSSAPARLHAPPAR